MIIRNAWKISCHRVTCAAQKCLLGSSEWLPFKYYAERSILRRP